MAIKDDRLKQFFSKQKVGAFDALAHKGKVTGNKPPPNEKKSEEKFEIVAAIESTVAKKEFLTNKLPTSESQDNQYHEKIDVLEVPPTPLSIRYQSVSEPLANNNFLVSKPLALSKQPVSNSLSAPLADSLADSLAKYDEIQFTDLRIFSKKERELITLVFWQCRNDGSLTSPPISTEEIRNTLKITAERVRNLVFRIVKKGGLKITQHKSGQSAYRVFELPKSLYQAMIDMQHYQIKRFSSDPLAQPLSNPLANASYSSSSDIKTITTDLPDEWKKIDCIPLKGINFSFIELKNIYRKCPQHIDHLVVQNSINQFAFGLVSNPERYKNMTAPSGVLVKYLCEGNPWVENGYIAPEEKLKAEKENKIMELLEKQFKEPKFLDWFNTLDENEKEILVPDGIKDSTSYIISKAVIQKEHAYSHFEHRIWPEILLELKLVLAVSQISHK